MLPFLTSYLSKAEFGILSIFLVLNTFSKAFIGMSMQVNVTKNFHKKEKSELSLIVGACLNILVLSALLNLVVLMLVITTFKSVFSVPSELLLILPFISIFHVLNQLNLAVLRNENRPYMFAIFEITAALIILLLTLILLFNTEIGWYSQGIAILVSYFIVGAAGMIYIVRNSYVTLNLKKDYTLDVAKTCIPLIPHVLGAVVIALSDRLFIESMIGVEAVAIYTLGYSFGVLVSLVSDSIIKAWSPWFYKTLVNPTFKNKLIIVKMTYLYILGLFLIAIIISIVSNLLFPLIFNVEFFESREFIIWISIGYAIQGVYKIFHPYLVHLGKTSYLAISSFIAAILNLLLNYYLIKEFGTIGAAYATIVAFSVSALLVFVFQARFYKMPWLRVIN